MGDGGAAAPRRKGPGRARHLSRPRRVDTDDPRRSRERALKVLFQADLRGLDPSVVLREVAEDDDARAMLDELDELAPAEVREPREVASSEVPEGATPAGATRIDETEAQRIWREEAERAARAASGRDVPAGGESPSGGSDVPGWSGGVAAIDGFTRVLVTGVHEHRAEVDELISRYARRWAISRMPVVDRTVLRLATFELLHEDTAPPVVINEAVELVKALSTDDSGRYVNGVLESIRKDIAARAAEATAAEGVDADPADADPADADPADADPADVEPADADPADVEPAVAVEPEPSQDG
jgi:transcription antitermination protein NusB